MDRRTFLATAASGIVGTAGCSSTSGSIDPGSTTYVQSFQFDGQNSGYAADRTGPTTEPEASWTLNTGSEQPLAPPVVREQTVFTMDGETVYACNAATGDVEWEAKVESPNGSYPAVGSDRLFVPSNDGVIAFDASDGTELWQASVDTPVGAPVVRDDTIMCASTSVTVVAKADGRVVQEIDAAQTEVGMAVSENDTICALQEDRLNIVRNPDANSDAVLVEGNPRAPPTIIGSTAYVTAQGTDDLGLIAVDLDDGETTMERGGDATVSVAGSTEWILTSSGVVGENVTAINPDRPDNPVWAEEVGQQISSPVMTESAVFVGAMGGPDDTSAKLKAIGPRIGSSWSGPGRSANLEWSREIEGGIAAPPAVTESALYVVDGSGRLHGFGASR